MDSDFYANEKRGWNVKPSLGVIFAGCGIYALCKTCKAHLHESKSEMQLLGNKTPSGNCRLLTMKLASQAMLTNTISLLPSP
jgi:hypothetical protein